MVSTFCSVEEVAIEYYKSKGYEHGELPFPVGVSHQMANFRLTLDVFQYLLGTRVVSFFHQQEFTERVARGAQSSASSFGTSFTSRCRTRF
jgi:hypothetical protein